jgi:hypothetical protein
MKKALGIVLIVIMLSLFTGCVEFIQMISIKNGVLHTSIRFTLQKSIFEMAASFSGEEVDYDEFLGIGEDTFSLLSRVAGEITKHETPYDIGAEITIRGPQKTIYSVLDGEYDFIPIKHNDKYILAIPNLGDGDEVDEFAMVFLSGAKYRIIIALADDLEHISQAKLFYDGGADEIYPVSNKEGCTISVEGSIMLIEIPMILLFMGDGKIFVELM